MSKKTYFVASKGAFAGAFREVGLPSGSVVRVLSANTHKRAAQAANAKIEDAIVELRSKAKKGAAA